MKKYRGCIGMNALFFLGTKKVDAYFGISTFLYLNN